MKRTVTYPVNTLDGIFMYSGAVGEQTGGGCSAGSPTGTLFAAALAIACAVRRPRR